MEAERLAMEREIVTQKELVDAMEKDLVEDAGKLDSRIVLDEYGRIKNYDQAILWDKEDVEQYEETLNGLEQAYDDLNQKQLALRDSALEKIEFNIEFNIEGYDDTIAYIEWVQEMLDNDTYDAARSIELMDQQTSSIIGKIDTYKSGLR